MSRTICLRRWPRRPKRAVRDKFSSIYIFLTRRAFPIESLTPRVKECLCVRRTTTILLQVREKSLHDYMPDRSCGDANRGMKANSLGDARGSQRHDMKGVDEDSQPFGAIRIICSCIEGDVPSAQGAIRHRLLCDGAAWR
jgi:hypothetical protein